MDVQGRDPAGKALKKYLLLAVILVAVYAQWRAVEEPRAATDQPEQRQSTASDDPLANAYAERRSGVQVSGEGRVIRILGDDSMAIVTNDSCSSWIPVGRS